MGTTSFRLSSDGRKGRVQEDDPELTGRVSYLCGRFLLVPLRAVRVSEALVVIYSEICTGRMVRRDEDERWKR